MQIIAATVLVIMAGLVALAVYTIHLLVIL